MDPLLDLTRQVFELTERLHLLETTVDKLRGVSFVLEPDTPQKVTRFTPPTEQESALEAARIGMDATRLSQWRNYYASNGWKVGRNPMKDWRAALRNWHLNSRHQVIPGSDHSQSCSPSGPQIVAWSQELETVRKRIQGITPEGHLDLDAKDRAELAKLKARSKELLAKLGREY